MFKLLISPDLCTIRNLISLTEYWYGCSFQLLRHHHAHFLSQLTPMRALWVNFSILIGMSDRVETGRKCVAEGWASLGLTQKKNKSNQPNFFWTLHKLIPLNGLTNSRYKWENMYENSFWYRLLFLLQDCLLYELSVFEHLERSFNLIVVLQYFTILLCNFNGYSFGDLPYY